MLRRKTVAVRAAAVIAAALASSQGLAAELFWNTGVTGDFTNTSNYTGTPTIPAPPATYKGTSDLYDIGGGGTANYPGTTSDLAWDPSRIRVGHNLATNPGAGTLFVTNGALTPGGNGGTGANGTDAGLVVGLNADGILNMSGGSITATRFIVIGSDGTNNNSGAITATGTLNLSGGTLRSSNENFLIGAGNAGVVNITGGNLFVENPGTSATAAVADLIVGQFVTSTYTQSAGTVRVSRSFIIDKGSTVSISGGTVETETKKLNATAPPNQGHNAGNFIVGRNGGANEVFNLSGTAVVNVGHRFLMGTNGAGTTGAVTNQTGGTLNVDLNMSISDIGGSSTYNFSGGTINTGFDYDANSNNFSTVGDALEETNPGITRIGRRGTGLFVQTGGVANFGTGLGAGDDDGGTTGSTGTYEISAGEVHTQLLATQTGAALRIGTAGTGTFRVVGDDGVIDVNGDMLVDNTTNNPLVNKGLGTLAYKFEAGDGLSVIDVSGTATFAKGSGLSLDSSIASPTQRFYDVLTAASIVDNGLVISPGWAHTIINGGANGKLLQVGQVATVYWDTNGATAGSGGPAPSGTWDGATSNFTGDSTGSSSTTAVTGYADDVSFGGIADATGTYTVNVSGSQQAHAVKVAQGNVTLTGGTIVAPIFDVAAGATATVASNLAGGPANSVTKTGAGVMTLTSAGTYTGGTTVAAGAFVLGAGGSLADAGAVDVTGGGTLDINTANETVGAVTLASGSITGTTGVLTGSSYAVQSGNISANLAGSAALTKTTAGTVTLSGANSYGGGTTVSAGTLVAAHGDAFGGGSVNVADGALAQAQAGLTKAVTVTTLNTNTSGKFDLTNNSMVIRSMTAAQVQAQLAAGYNAGHWDGPTGITSSSAAASTETSVGYASNSSLNLTEFKGVSGLTASDVLVKYTYAGDANLDGKVDIGDLGLLAGAWQQSGKVWFDGDFTYNGTVDIGDLGLLAGNWQKGVAPGTPLEALDAAMAQFAAFEGVAVPEPTSLSLLALGGLALGRRRRARHN